LGVGLTVVTHSVWGLTLATVGGFVCAFVVRLVRVPAVMRLRPPRGEIRKALPQLPAMLKFGLKLLPGIVIGGFSTQIGVWVLGGVAGDTEVGAFSRSLGLATKLQEAGYRVC